MVLPRRSYSPLIGRLLHDRTADKIAAVVSRIPHAAATIVPFDVQSRLEVLHARQVAQAEQAEQADRPPSRASGPSRSRPARRGRPGRRRHGRTASGRARPGQPGGTAPGRRPPGRARTGPAGTADRRPAPRRGPGPPRPPACPPVVAAPSGLRRMLRGRRRGADQPPPALPADDHAGYDRPAPSAGVNPIGSLARPGRATVEGRVRAVEIRPVERNSVLAVDVADSTGDLTALFYGRSHIPGRRVRGPGALPRAGRAAPGRRPS